MTDRKHAKIISQKRAFDSYYKLDVMEIEPASLKHDGYGVRMEREILRGGEVVSVLLYDAKADLILLNQQFRLGPFLRGDENPFMFECAAGRIDQGETAEEAAKREAFEETGMRVKDLAYIGMCYPSPASVDQRFYMYAGLIEDPVHGFHGLEHEGEEIQTHIVTADKALEMLDTGIITNSATVISLHWFGRHREKLRATWLEK